jgi:hypothetical protein
MTGRILRLLLASLALAALSFSLVHNVVTANAAPATPYHGTLRGSVVAFKPAGMEPDFDLIDKVVLKTILHASGYPPMTLILDVYLENFQPDTTPVLPDILNGKTQAQNLGGFLQGAAIVIDPSGNILYVGEMLAEAFLDNSNHMLVTAKGRAAAKGGSLRLKSIFVLNRRFQVHGTIWGNLRLPAAARLALERKGSGGRTLNAILKQFVVPPPPMRGTAGNGKPTRPFELYGHSTNAPVSSSVQPQQPADRPAWMAPLGGVLIFVAVLLFGLWLRERVQSHNVLRR